MATVTVELAPLVIVLDVSGSLGSSEILARSVSAVNDLVAARPQGPLALVTVGGEVRVIAEWGVAPAEALALLERVEVGGATPLHQGVMVAASLLDQRRDGASGVMVVIADGDDSGQGTSLGEALGALAGREVWAIEVSTDDTDRPRLESLVGDGGGRVVGLDDLVGRAALLRRLQPGEHTVVTVPAVSPTTVPVVSAPTTVPVVSAPTTVPVVEVPTTTVGPAPAALLLGGGVAWFVGLVLVMAVLWPRQGATSGLGAVADRLSSGAERLLALAGRRRRLSAVLDAAGVAVRPGEAVMGVATFAVASGLILGAVVSVAFGVLVVVLVVITSVAMLNRRVQRRQRAFAEQLPDLLASVSSALRAGYALSQALDAVARNVEAPARDELARVVAEMRLGRASAEALAGMAARTASRDFAWAVTAIEIHREVGGDLATIFDTVARTARERLHLARDVRALTAEGRVSAMVLTALPPGLVVVLSAASPGYLEPLLDGPGPALLALSGVLMGLGWWWMRMLVRSGVRA